MTTCLTQQLFVGRVTSLVQGWGNREKANENKPKEDGLLVGSKCGNCRLGELGLRAVVEAILNSVAGFARILASCPKLKSGELAA